MDAFRQAWSTSVEHVALGAEAEEVLRHLNGRIGVAAEELVADRAVVVEAEDWLLERDDVLAARQVRTHVGLRAQAPRRVVEVGGLEDDAVLAFALGARKQEVRARQQLVDRGHVGGQEHRGDGCGQRDAAVAVLDDGRGDGQADALGHARDLGGLGLRKEDHELVAADAADVVDGAYGCAQPAADLLEHHVADGMSVLIVDGLEIVEIDHQHGAADIVAPEMLDFPGESLLQAAAVEQLGQRLDEREALERLVGALELLLHPRQVAHAAMPLDGVTDRSQQRVVADGAFQQIVLGADMERFRRQRLIALARQDDDRDLMHALLQPIQRLQILRVRQPEVQDHHIDPALLHRLARRGRGGHMPDAEARTLRRLQQLPQRKRGAEVILHQQQTKSPDGAVYERGGHVHTDTPGE